MSNSICKFMPAKDYNKDIKTINFVFESDFKTLRQPFIKPIYVMNIVVKGSAVLKLNSREYKLGPGDLFFAFPGGRYEIDGSDDFKYMYISFMGSYASLLLNELDININNPVFNDLGVSVDFWLDSIRRINQLNANILTESVLFYSLSFINNRSDKVTLKKNNENLFETIVSYTECHFREQDLSLRKVADIFSYTEKYLSYLFKKNMETGFNKYLNNLRIQYACKLIEEGEDTISEISRRCGFADSFYFSKVFKKRTGISPTGYIKKMTEI